MELIEHTPADVLYELGIRAYTGSRDVPKDDEKALGLLKLAHEQALVSKNQHDIDMAEFYMAIIHKA